MFKGNHRAFECTHKNPRLCRKCERSHNYMLHDDSDDTSVKTAVPPVSDNSSVTTSTPKQNLEEIPKNVESAIAKADMAEIQRISNDVSNLASNSRHFRD